jgi:hypothetical protein
MNLKFIRYFHSTMFSGIAGSTTSNGVNGGSAYALGGSEGTGGNGN